MSDLSDNAKAFGYEEPKQAYRPQQQPVDVPMEAKAILATASVLGTDNSLVEEMMYNSEFSLSEEGANLAIVENGEELFKVDTSTVGTDYLEKAALDYDRRGNTSMRDRILAEASKLSGYDKQTF